MIQEADNIQ